MFKGGDKERFVVNGTQIFLTLESKIQTYLPKKKIQNLDILDFGCGVGRVAMPFYYKYKRPNAAIDIQRFAIEFMTKTLPGTNPTKSKISPPLDYPDASFDVIYAISVWTHMNKDTGYNWLSEVNRLLRPGGIALLTTSSYWVLDQHRKHKVRSELWKDVTDDELKKNGFVFRSNDYKGIDEPYGEIVYDPDWIKAEWSKIIPVVEQEIRAIGGVAGGRQDLNVLVKPK